METTLDFIFFLSFFVSVLLGALSYMTSRRLKASEFKHLTEFWCALTTMMVISFALQARNETLAALSLLGWIWPVKTIFQISEDMSGREFFFRPKIITMAVGAFLTLALAISHYPFMVYTLPFCFSIGAVGLMILADVYKSKKIQTMPPLGHVSFALLGLFFLIRALYPFWRMSDISVYGATAHLMVLIGMGASTLAYYMEQMKQRHESQLEGVLKERNNQLFCQSKYSELGMMSAGIAHEINNPLAIIQAKVTQLLRIHKTPERHHEIADGLEQILYTSERINRTIQGVREFVHQDERVQDEEFSVKNLVDDVLAFCGQRMRNHGVNLRFYGLENYILSGHKIQLEQVLLNLLNNSFDAIEYHSDKWIEMSVRETDHTIQMYFKDSGTGIPAEIANRIMEPFFTTKNVGKGTGLGLALARGIAEKHGGSLVYVPDSRHTTFKLELPKVGKPIVINHHRKSSPPEAFH